MVENKLSWMCLPASIYVWAHAPTSDSICICLDTNVLINKQEIEPAFSVEVNGIVLSYCKTQSASKQHAQCNTSVWKPWDPKLRFEKSWLKANSNFHCNHQAVPTFSVCFLLIFPSTTEIGNYILDDIFAWTFQHRKIWLLELLITFVIESFTDYDSIKIWLLVCLK